MIVSAVSAILGMVGGVIPDITKEITASREHGRELEMLKTQADLQVKLLEHQTDAKLAEIEGNAVVEELRAFRSQMSDIYKQQSPTGIKFVDGFNSLIRPSAAALIMLLFFGIAGTYAWGIIEATDWSDSAAMQSAATTLWASLIGDAVQAVMGYLFGYRSTAAVRKRLAR